MYYLQDLFTSIVTDPYQSWVFLGPEILVFFPICPEIMDNLSYNEKAIAQALALAEVYQYLMLLVVE